MDDSSLSIHGEATRRLGQSSACIGAKGHCLRAEERTIGVRVLARDDNTRLLDQTPGVHHTEDQHLVLTVNETLSTESGRDGTLIRRLVPGVVLQGDRLTDGVTALSHLSPDDTHRSEPLTIGESDTVACLNDTLNSSDKELDTRLLIQISRHVEGVDNDRVTGCGTDDPIVSRRVEQLIDRQIDSHPGGRGCPRQRPGDIGTLADLISHLSLCSTSCHCLTSSVGDSLLCCIIDVSSNLREHRRLGVDEGALVQQVERFCLQLLQLILLAGSHSKGMNPLLLMQFRLRLSVLHILVGGRVGHGARSTESHSREGCAGQLGSVILLVELWLDKTGEELSQVRIVPRAVPGLGVRVERGEVHLNVAQWHEGRCRDNIGRVLQRVRCLQRPNTCSLHGHHLFEGEDVGVRA